MKTFNEVLAIKDKKERNHAVKQAFSFAADPIIIDGYEKKTITALVNLTKKLVNITDVFSLREAKELIKNIKWQKTCAKTIKEVHTHNLKYANVRAQGCIRAHKPQALPLPYLFSGSIHKKRHYGWMCNSADYHRALLFNAEYIWHGRVTCLARLLSDNNKPFVSILKSLGATPEYLTTISECTDISYNQNCTFPNTINSAHMVLTLLPLTSGGYLSITPVPSTELQRQIHHLCTSKSFRYTQIVFPRPQSVSGFVASTGGKVKVMFYPPYLSKPKQDTNSTLNISKNIINTKVHIEILRKLAYPEAGSYKYRMNQHKNSLRQLEDHLRKWLAFRDIRSSELSEKELLFEIMNEYHHLLEHQPRSRSLAYHNNLLIPIKTVLLRLIKEQLDGKHLPPPFTKNNLFIYINNLDISGANAESCPYLVGLPSLTAVDGFVHNYTRRLAKILNTTIQDKGFALGLNSFSLSKGIPSYELTRFKDNKLVSNGLKDGRIYNGSIDILISLSIEGVNSLQPTQNQILAALPGRFASGVPTLTHANAHKARIINTQLNLEDTLLTSSCHWITDKIEQFNQYFQASKKPEILNEFSNLLCEQRKWFPNTCGFYYLERPQPRMGADHYKHAFAEPIVGISALLSPHEVHQYSISELLNKLIWRRQCNHELYLLKTGEELWS